MTVRITPTDNGPYEVAFGEGELEVVAPSGAPIRLKRSPMYFCRCGGSTTKPFCDGTHSKIGFQAAEAAVQRSDGNPA
jgi:CDGSH-type Zn-finger protein